MGALTRALVVNAGSSSLKLDLIGPGEQVEASATVDPWDGDPASAEEAVAAVLDGRPAPELVGHRVVHGGHESDPATVTGQLRQRLLDLAPLAPLHQERAVAALDATQRALPDARHVACFDTAFHTTIPEASRTYALPAAWRDRWGLERAGFHGLSHAWVARRAPAVAGRAGETPRIVSCHLGGGSSLCAIAESRSVDTTMGLTPLDGVPMKTRSGAVDPGILLWLLAEGGLTVTEVRDGLDHRAGMAGLSGTSGDIRDVYDAVDGGDRDAHLALAVLVHRIRQAVATMAASLDGLDLLVFTGGAGEHSTRLRADITDGLGFLGVGIDDAVNTVTEVDGDITAEGAPVRTVVVTSREDLEIVRQVTAQVR